MTTVPDLLYSDTERTLATALGDLLSSRAGAPDVLARTEKPDTYDLDLWRTVAAEIGLAGLLIPEALGGAGASYRELAAAAEQFGAAVAPIPYLGSAAVATATLLSAAKSAVTPGGTTPLDPPAHGGLGSSHGGLRGPHSPAAPHTPPAAGLLRRMADGGMTAALVVPADTLPGAPFPGAVRVAGKGDGDMTKLRGTVPGVADALLADVLLIPAEGVPNALYLVEVTAPGVHRAPVVSMDMTRQLCDVSLDDAPARQVAVGAAATEAVDAGLRAGAAVLAAEQLGLAQRCLDITVAYVKERRQFARPIGSFQALKHRLADLWTTITLARATSRYAAACLADGDPDAPVAVALAKSACSDAAVRAAEECVQMHGGIGFTWEHPAHLYLKRAKASAVLFGTPAAHRNALGTLVNLPAPS
jgi:alkylation response protein AidB-like acyl-CoA dehydrogenase